MAYESELNTDLIESASNGHAEVVELILDEDGFDVDFANQDGATPLVSAAAGGHLEVVDLLLEKNANVNKLGHNKTSAVRAALAGGHNEVAELLIRDDNFDVNSGDWTPLNSAAGQGFLGVVRLLLKKGADVNKKDANDLTALYLASANGHAKVVKRLLSAAEKSKKDPKGPIESLEMAPDTGLTPLIVAATEGHSQVVRLLIEKGASLEAVGAGKETALKGAIKNGHADVIKLLYDKAKEIRKKKPDPNMNGN